MEHIYTVFQLGNFTNDTLVLGPVLRAGQVKEVRAGCRTAFTGTTSVGTVDVLDEATSVLASVIALGSAAHADHKSVQGVLHATVANLNVEEGDILTVTLAGAAAGDGALGIDTTVSVCIAVI